MDHEVAPAKFRHRQGQPIRLRVWVVLGLGIAGHGIRMMTDLGLASRPAQSGETRWLMMPVSRDRSGTWMAMIARCYSTLVMSPTKKLMFRLAAAVAAFELLAWAALAISRVN
jgi:hypothetical protein